MPEPSAYRERAPQPANADYLPCTAMVVNGGVRMDCRGQARVAVVLADLDQVHQEPDWLHTHFDRCWLTHAGCLAARIRRTLTEEDHDAR